MTTESNNAQENATQPAGSNNFASASEHDTKQQIETLNNKITDLENTLLSTKTELEKKITEEKLHLADKENLRNRSAKQIVDAQVYGIQKFAKEMLDVADSFEKALESANQASDTKTMLAGIKMTNDILIKTFNKADINVIDPLNQPFDPDLHEAISIAKDPKKAPNTVIQVIQKGYKIKDRLLRPAMVIVNKD